MRNSAAISDPYPRRRILVGLGVQSDADLEIYQGVVDYFAAGKRCDVVPIGMDFERRVSQLAAKGGVDGIIGEFAGGGWLMALRRQGIPVVHVRQSFAVDDLPSVGIDYRTAGRLGAEFLLESGVARLVWVGSGTSLPASEVLDGLRCRFPGEVIQMELDSVVNNPVAVNGSCLCFAESRIAGPLVRSLNDHGLSIPRDITLLAFGRSVQASLWTGLDLSAVVFPWHQVGKSAAQRIARMLDATAPTNAGEKGTDPNRQGLNWVTPGEVYRGGSVERMAVGEVVVRRALALVRERMGDGLRVAEVARLLGVSRRKLEMAFRERGLQPPNREFEELRMDRARELLRTTTQSVSEIGHSCGYSSVYAFSTAFKRVTGQSPRIIRNLHLQRAGDVS